MKNFRTLILLVFSIFLIVSCGSDDDSNNTPNYSIVGKWKLSNYSENGVEDFDPNDCDDKEEIEFTSDGKLYGTYYYENSAGDCTLDETDTANYTLDGNTIEVTYENETSSSTYALSENNLVITYTDDTDGTIEVSTYDRL